MSIVKSSSVFCDVNGENCTRWTAEVADSHGGAPEARRQAKASGWVRRNGKDICPSCDPIHVHEFDPIHHYEPCVCGTFRSEVP